jgi:glycosyltransferase involved in cell wall biosynthesis
MRVAWLGNLANVGFNYVRVLNRGGVKAVLYAPRHDLRQASTNNPENEYAGASREPFIQYHRRGYASHLLNLMGRLGWMPSRERRLAASCDLIQAQTCREIAALRIRRRYGVPYVGLVTGADLSEVAFAGTRFARLYRRALSEAGHLFLVNINQFDLVDRLDLGLASWSYLPLCVNLERIGRMPPPAKERLVIYSIARLDWATARPSGKGNDVFLRGYARYVRRHGAAAFDLRLRDWGSDRVATRRLVAELGIADSVRFVPAEGREEFFRSIAAADVVVDQFRMGAIGLAALESMAAGRAVFAWCNQDWARRAYGGAIPVLNSAGEEQVCEQLARLTPGMAAECGAVAGAWVREHHSEARILNRLRDTYAEVASRSLVQATEAGRR